MRGSGHTGQQKWIPAAARGAGQQNPLDLPCVPYFSDQSVASQGSTAAKCASQLGMV